MDGRMSRDDGMRICMEKGKQKRKITRCGGGGGRAEGNKQGMNKRWEGGGQGEGGRQKKVE